MEKEILSFIKKIDNASRREDAVVLLELIGKESGCKPYLSGSIIGYGTYQYKYDSGREGESFLVGFSPRKQNTAIYIMPGFSDYEKHLAKLGKHKVSKTCLYINKLADVDLKVLRGLIKKSVADMKKKYKVKAS